MPVLAHRGSLRYVVGKFVRRHRVGVGAAIALVLVLLGFAATMALQARRIAKERDRANREAEASRRVAEFMTGVFRVSNPSERVGNTVTAREILDKASREIGTALAKDPELQGRMMYEMGMAYLNLGLYSRAEELLGRSLQADSAAGREGTRQSWKTRQRLAWTLYQEGRFAEAESQQRKLLDLEHQALGPDHEETIGIMGDLATTLSEEGQLVEAEKLQRNVLELQKRILGPEAAYTLVSMNNLASILHHEGRLEEADRLERECIEIKRRVAGPENLSTMHYMITEASIQADMGKLDESENSLRQLVEIEHRVLAPNQPEIAVTLYELASVAAKRGRTEEALSLLQQAIDIGLLPRIALQMGEDPDMSVLHGNSRFAALVAQARHRAASQKGSD
jgi:tetratricopeptide (TPR) repeat protein